MEWVRLRPATYDLTHGWAAWDAAHPHRKHSGVKLIHKSDLSTPDARRSREVSPDEFKRIAAKGAAQYARLGKNKTPTSGLDKHFTSIIADAHKEVSKSWGGATYDAHTGAKLPADADTYAITARPPGVESTHIPEGSSKREMAKAMRAARAKYGDILAKENHHLGVFHNDDTHSIEIDPVVTVPKEQVETIGAFTHAVGGAYHFKSGDGFWPPHVADGVE